MLTQRRGKNVAVAGVALQCVIAVVLLVLWFWTGSLTSMATTWFVAGGVGLWLVTALLFYSRQLARREALELEQIAARGGAKGTIFESDRELELRPAAARAAAMDRWVIPVFTLGFAAYHAAVAVLTLRYLGAVEPPLSLPNTGQAALIGGLVLFAGFLFSFYCTGMASRPEWRLLRAAGSYLRVNVAVIFFCVYRMTSIKCRGRSCSSFGSGISWVPPRTRLSST